MATKARETTAAPGEGKSTVRKPGSPASGLLQCEATTVSVPSRRHGLEEEPCLILSFARSDGEAGP